MRSRIQVRSETIESDDDMRVWLRSYWRTSKSLRVDFRYDLVGSVNERWHIYTFAFSFYAEKTPTTLFIHLLDLESRTSMS